MSVQWHTYADAQAAADACAHKIAALIEEALAGQELATLAVSGGTTPRLMFERLAAAPVGWNRVHLFWVDERLFPPPMRPATIS